MYQVAVLNYDLSFNNVKDWKRAIVLVELGRADVLVYSDNVVRTVNKVFRVPLIVKLKDRIQNLYKKQVRFSKKNLLVRDGNKCCYCGKHFKHKSDVTIDHVLPRSRGGKTSYENCVLSCFSCNTRKNDRTPEEAGMSLIKKPYKPTLAYFMALKLKAQGWEKRLSKVYQEILSASP